MMATQMKITDSILFPVNILKSKTCFYFFFLPSRHADLILFLSGDNLGPDLGIHFASWHIGRILPRKKKDPHLVHYTGSSCIYISDISCRHRL